MRVLVCGDRNWTNLDRVREVLKRWHSQDWIDVIIEGEARGADTCGRVIAEELGIPVEKYPANWTKHGKAAGPIRNQEMLTKGKPDAVIAFHNDILKSKGTRHMCDIAKKAGLIVYIAREYGRIDGY